MRKTTPSAQCRLASATARFTGAGEVVFGVFRAMSDAN
jgi:hypothetical protein